MIESGAAICARLGHLEGCTCWVPASIVTDAELVQWLMGVDDEKFREIAVEWEKFIVGMAAMVLSAGCPADARETVTIDPDPA